MLMQFLNETVLRHISIDDGLKNSGVAKDGGTRGGILQSHSLLCDVFVAVTDCRDH